MRILLIFPRFKYPCGDPPLGVAYLAAVARQAGAKVEIFDTTFVRRPLAVLRQKLQTIRYDAVGISVMTSMLAAVQQIAALIDEVSPQTTVIAGGPHATVEPGQTLALRGVDAVASGEAEESWRRLIEADLDFTEVPGFSYLRDGEVISTGPTPLVEDIDTISYPAWDLLPMPQYLDLWYQLDAVAYRLRGTSVIAARGCPYDCSYCQPTLRKLFGRRLRYRSPDNIIGELDELKRRYDIGGIMWLDDTFGLNRTWLSELCQGLVDWDAGLVWGCNLRADIVEHQTLAMMKQAGLRIVHLGIESATKRVLDEVYNKGITVEQVREAVHTAKELGLCVRGYFMLGAPGESEQEVRDSIRLANELPLDDVTFSITTPLPGTHLYQRTKQIIACDFSSFDYYKSAVYDSDEVLAAGRLNWLKKQGYLQFYLGRRRLWRTVRSVLGISGLRKMLVKVKRF